MNTTDNDPLRDPYYGEGNRATIDEVEKNPYAPARASSKLLGQEPLSLDRTFLRWLLVCSVSAAPSFLLGLMPTNGRFAGMICGIAVFIIGYTFLDYRTARLAWRQNKLIRTTLKITYGTRIAISILFPVAIFVDMMCGMISMSLLEVVVGQEFTSGSMGFIQSLLTTLVQGCVLNFVMAIYGVLMFGLVYGIHQFIQKRSSKPKTTAVDPISPNT